MGKVFADQSALQDEHGDAPRGEYEGPQDQPQLDDPGDSGHSGDHLENQLDEVHSKIHNNLLKHNSQLKKLEWWMASKLKLLRVVEPMEMHSKSLMGLGSLHKDHLEEFTPPRVNVPPLGDQCCVGGG